MFKGATGLKKVNISGAITAIPQNFFQGCTALEDVTIPETVTRIHEYAFDNTGLKSITIPASVEVVEGYSFQNCKSLSSVTFAAGSKLNTIYNYCFFGCSALTSIALPSSIQSVEPYSFSQTGLTSIDFGGVKTIKANAFSNCGGLTTLNIPEGVTELGDYAFKGCTNLTSVAVPNTVTSLGSYLFQGCTGITSFAIPSHIKSIGAYTFANMTGLTEITLPSTLKSMGEGAFSGCTGVTKLTFEDGLANIPQKAFEGCTGIKNVEIPASVTSIGMNAFSGCSSMEYIDLRSATSITLSKFKRNTSHSTFNDVCNGLPVSAVVYLPKGFAQPATLFHDGVNNIDDEIINYVFTDESDNATCPDFQHDIAGIANLPYGFTATKLTVTGVDISGKQGLYLPFSIDDESTAALGTLQKVKVNEGTVTLEPATSVEANTPYLLTTNAAVTSINADNSEVKPCVTAPTEGFIGGTGEAFPAPDNTYTWDAEAGKFVAATSGEKITVLLTSFYYVGELTKTEPVVEVNPAGAEITIGTGGYSTFCSSINVDFSGWGDDVKAYVATGYNNGNITMQRVTNIGAGQGVLLTGTEGATVTVAAAQDDQVGWYLNLMVGVTESMKVEQVVGASTNFTNYYLTTKEGKTGFFKVASTGVTIGAGKAYLQLPTTLANKIETGSPAPCINLIFEDDVTGISERVEGVANGQTVYDLQGRRVAQPQKGLYIVNGKKVLIK